MRKPCIWSNRFDEPVREVELELLNRWGMRIERKAVVVCAAHEPEVRRFAGLETGWGRLAMPLTLILTVLAIAGTFVEPLALTSGSIVAMGVLFLIFPFATPETVSMMGLEKSIHLARFGGLVLIALGAAIMML
jgi:hypothetical protein